MPSDAVLQKIAELEPFFGPAKEFLEDQVAAYLLRTGSGLNKPPRSPFFADTYLTAESSLDYLTKWRENLRFIINASSSHETFSGMVRSDVLSGEVQWLEGALSFGPPDPEAIRPPVWWMIASVQLGRFKYQDICQLWLEGTAPCLSAMLRPKPIMEVLTYERGRLKNSKPLRDLLDEAARTAIEEATYGWLQQHKLGTLLKDEHQSFQLINADPDFQDAVNGAVLVAPAVPLAERDRRLRKVVGAFAVKQGLEVLPAYWWRGEATDAPKKRSGGTLGGPDVDDLMAGFKASSTRFDQAAEE